MLNVCSLHVSEYHQCVSCESLRWRICKGLLYSAITTNMPDRTIQEWPYQPRMAVRRTLDCMLQVLFTLRVHFSVTRALRRVVFSHHCFFLFRTHCFFCFLCISRMFCSLQTTRWAIYLATEHNRLSAWRTTKVCHRLRRSSMRGQKVGCILLLIIWWTSKQKGLQDLTFLIAIHFEKKCFARNALNLIKPIVDLDFQV